MGMTMIEKIFARTSGQERVEVGEIVDCEVDQVVMIDMQFSPASHRWRTPTRIADPDRLAVILDHGVPAPSVSDALNQRNAREFVEQFGVGDFFDVGKHGIAHQVIAEQGLARPGEMLACVDSHTCAAGAFNTAARGMGGPEMLSILCTGRTWHKVAPTIRYELEGTKPTNISGKDIFLHIAGHYGSAANHNLEFGGSGLASVPMNDRRTIATQGMEVGADFTTFPADDVCLEYLDGRTTKPFTPLDSDPDASYADVRIIDLASVEPQVAKPGAVMNNTAPISEVAGIKVDQCFIGSCANGQLEDLAIAADIVRDKRVAPGTRLLVTPASQAVYLDAVKLGYVETLAAAGAVVTSSTCGACLGYHMGVVGPGEVCLTASTRNFKGRMGALDSEVYMASPAVVAASALTGVITDPAKVA